MNSVVILRRFLRALAVLDLLALLVILFPHSWMEAIHAWLGLGEMPDDIIVEYFARSGSLLYALHGATLFYVSLDVERYWRLIHFLALVSLVHGSLVLMLDLSLGLPFFWVVTEGPFLLFTGVFVLWLQSRVTPKEETI